MHAEDWLAFNMIQTCIDYDRIQEAVTADYCRTPVKPVVMAEGGYEGVEFNKLQTAHDIRKQAYWTQLSGGHHVYGHNDAWRFPLNWTDWLDSPGSRSLDVFRQVITGRPEWWNMIPDPSIFVAGAGTGYALNTAARSAAGDWLLVYISEPGQVSLRLNEITVGDRASVEWIDPVGGERTALGIFATSGVQRFTTPKDWEDAVLLVEAE